MSYLVLARKWRPMTFDDLVGQEHVSRTLSNAIVSGRIAHAFLFTGVRGVGKTTSARILAKSLNCEAGPTPKPCLQCPACTEIAASNDIDVQEIDGASYNGVDEVRRLQESLPYRPSRDRFKVVIVDEVHMLSSNAWNAFLKTLEEPPPHVKFIFATTEVHKVPVTILSRCQRYDFKLISSSSIAKQLRHVLDQEGIAADDAALGLMAREAAGSMRDAMSLLDQAIAWGGDKLVGEEIARVLGIAGRGKLLELAQAMVHGDAQAVLMIVAHLADQGFDLVQVARDTLEVLRDLVVVKVCNSPDSLTDLTPEELATMRALVADARGEDLIRLHHGFSTGFDQVVHAPQQRSALEMLLLRLVFRPPLLPVDDLISRLDGIERRLVGRGAALPRSGGPVALRNHRGATAFEPTERTESVSAGDRAVMAARAQPSAAVKDPAPLSRVAAHREIHPVADTEPWVAETVVNSSPIDMEIPVQPTVGTAPSERSQEQPVRRATEPAPTEPAPGSEAAWRAILETVQQQNAALAAVLEHAIPVEISPHAVHLAIEEGSFYADRARDDQAVDLLTRVVRARFHASTEVSLSLLDTGKARGRTLFDINKEQRLEQERKARAELESHKLVQAAIESLGARVHLIKLDE
ncbi:MAG TPA: DNA polymerase III subunit gamma/tau [Polyangiaceae bacterium]|nr:DNA polymerase III subunit gamma/tau [Polyangiaceae bacterium]